MMEEGRKRPPEYDISGEYSGAKKPRSPAMSDGEYGDSEDILACLSVDEEAVGEMMELLEREVTSPVAKVKFIDYPYSPPMIFQTYSSFVTINGNEESCGSSFSASESSVMVSIDVGGVFINNGGGGGGGGGGGSKAFGAIWSFQTVENGGACGEEEEEVARYLVKEEEEEEEEDGEKSVVDGIVMNGCDCVDWEDVLLAKFLGEDLC